MVKKGRLSGRKAPRPSSRDIDDLEGGPPRVVECAWKSEIRRICEVALNPPAQLTYSHDKISRVPTRGRLRDARSASPHAASRCSGGSAGRRKSGRCRSTAERRAAGSRGPTVERRAGRARNWATRRTWCERRPGGTCAASAE